MARTALVTGAAGFTGTHLVRQLTGNGWNVVATDLEPADRQTFYTETDNAPHPVYDASIARAQGEEFVAADLTNPETLAPLFVRHDYDVVFHTASLFDYFADSDTLHAVNVDGARNIAELAARNGVDHFVNFSTLGVLGEAGFEEPRDGQSSYEPDNR
jgi:dihydroflavonol-4-reductase